MNYELELTEEHLEAAVTWEKLEGPAYKLAHCRQALEIEGVLHLPHHGDKCIASWQDSSIPGNVGASQALQSKWHVVSGNAFKQPAGRRGFIQMSLKIYMHS